MQKSEADKSSQFLQYIEGKIITKKPPASQKNKDKQQIDSKIFIKKLNWLKIKQNAKIILKEDLERKK